MKNKHLAIILTIIILITVGSLLYVKNTYNTQVVEIADETEEEWKTWRNEKLNYEFKYPASAVIKYANETPDGTCTYINIIGEKSTTTLAFIKEKSLSSYLDSSDIICHATDAPFGVDTKEPIQIAALKMSVEAECTTSYFHKENYDADLTNDMQGDKYLYDIPSESVDNNRCYVRFGTTDPIQTYYYSQPEYGFGITTSELENQNSIVRKIIGSFSYIQ